MKFFEKTKGAISIFLVIILVPMMTVSSLFIDASKVKLGKAMVTSAGDLALNTALTNYDTELKDLYGLLATAQNTDDLFARLEDYYRTCIISAGVSDEDATLYTDQIMASLGLVSQSGDTADIMNMQLVDFTAEKQPNANLANATILKKQIIDFMKYRAPINTGLSFISALSSFSTLSKQSELVEKKQEYYEAQQTVLEDLKTAWSHIAAYNKSVIVTDANYLQNLKPTLDGYADDYKDYGKRTIMSLYKKYASVVQYKYNLEVFEEKEKKYDIVTGELGDEVDVYRIKYNNTNYYSYLSDNYNNPYDFVEKKFPTVQQVKKAIEGYYNAKQTLNNKHAPHYSNSYYDIQFIAQKKAEIEAYTSAAINFFLAYQKFKNVELWLDGYVEAIVKDEDGNTITKESILSERYTYGNVTKTLGEWIASINAEGEYSNRMGTFMDDAGKYKYSVGQAIAAYRDQWAITDDVDISTAITNIHDVAAGQVTTLEQAMEHLTEAVKFLNSAKTKLTTTVSTAKQAWSGVAGDNSIKDTSLAKQDKAEINQLDTYLNAENIDRLVRRLENINNDLTAVRDQVKEYKFADVFIGDIEGYSGDKGLETVAGNKWNDLNSLSMEETEVTNTATTRATSAWKAGNIDTSWINQSAHQPNLLQDKVSLYTYLSSHFSNTKPAELENTQSSPSSSEKTEDEGNGKNFFQSIKDTSKGKSDSATSGTGDGQAATEDSKNNNLTSNESRPSKTSSGDGGAETPSGGINTNIDDDDSGEGAAGKSASALGGLFSSEFLSAIANMGESLRDKLYISDYVMSMFSYDTIENEYIKKNNVQTIPEGAIETLTKCPINATNNYAYGSEIEYIIYGGTNSSNLGKAYGSIFAIRFGFNLVYAFATSEIRESALAIATPISAATLGIIPVPLIQAVIIIGIACCESALDLGALRDGYEVPLYKSSKTWRCSITGLMNMAENKAADALSTVAKDVANSAVDAGVNKLNDLLNMTDEKFNELISGSFNDVKATVTSAYDQIITENAEAAIQQLTTLVNSAVEKASFLEANETYENKKTQMKTWVKEQLQAWGAQQTGDDLAAKAKRAAVNVIVQNSDACINALFDEVEKAIRETPAVDSIDSMLNQGTILVQDKVDKVGGVVMEKIAAVRNQISYVFNNTENEIKSMKDELINSLSDSINSGADNLKEKLNSGIDKIFGTTGGAQSGDSSGTGAASLFSFSYSDYLRLFLLIALFANEGKTILRTADVIEANMKHKGDDDFKLEKSAAYVRVTAEVLVKPTLLALPLFADVENNPVDNTGWYTITYTGIAGY
ncbi:MAG: hypothetical protein IJB65_06865 [Clostridia bacterium]|nr:hypothetical protein [Clostridia bacterium]